MNNESSRKRSMDRRNGSVDQPAESIFEYLNNHKNNDVAHSESRPNPKTQVPIPNPNPTPSPAAADDELFQPHSKGAAVGQSSIN